MQQTNEVPWTLVDVLLVLILRFGLDLLLIQGILPLLGGDQAVLGEITDRFVTAAIVICYVQWRYGLGLGSLGLKLCRFTQQVAWGLAGGFILLFAGMLSEYLYTAATGQPPQVHALVKMAAQAGTLQNLMVPILLGGVLAPVSEEIYYRGFAYPAFRRKFGIRLGILASAVFFAVLHFNAVWLLEITAVGIGLAYLYQRLGSLIPAMLAHGLVNTAKIWLVYFFAANY